MSMLVDIPLTSILNLHPEVIEQQERASLLKGVADAQKEEQTAIEFSVPTILAKLQAARTAFAKSPTPENRAELERLTPFDPLQPMGSFAASKTQVAARDRALQIGREAIAPILLKVGERLVRVLQQEAQQVREVERSLYARFELGPGGPSPLLAGLERLVLAVERELIALRNSHGWPLPSLLGSLAVETPERKAD